MTCNNVTINQKTLDVVITQDCYPDVVVSITSPPSIVVSPVGIQGPKGEVYTPEELKVLYESNLDTNAFTDLDKAKLDSIDLSLTWRQLVLEWSNSPTELAQVVGGTVFSYVLDGVTRYRFVPNPYNPELDAFYESFDGAVLSNLIAVRGG